MALRSQAPAGLNLRGTHETLLLDAGVPVHVVAAGCEHDPAALLRIFAKRTTKADTSAAAIIGALSKGMLGSYVDAVRPTFRPELVLVAKAFSVAISLRH